MFSVTCRGLTRCEIELDKDCASSCLLFNVLYDHCLFRCFTFGIGSGASTELVEGLAMAGNGSAEFVKEGERLQKVSHCFNQIN